MPVRTFPQNVVKWLVDSSPGSPCPAIAKKSVNFVRNQVNRALRQPDTNKSLLTAPSLL